MIHRIVDAIYPRLCHLCEEPLIGDEEYICDLCLSRLPRTGYLNRPDNAVEQRFAGIFPFEHATSVFFYVRGNDISTLIQDFKYRNFPGLARRLGRLAYDELIFTDFFSDIDVIVPVPLHWTRRLRRTYNQAEMLATGIADRAHLPLRHLLRARMHVSQTHRTLAQRSANARGKYYAVSCPDITTQHILLVDDVCTTGSTLTVAAEALTAAYPQVRLSILTLAATV